MAGPAGNARDVHPHSGILGLHVFQTFRELCRAVLPKRPSVFHQGGGMSQAWLNGWIRHGDYVYIGTFQCCVGCGRVMGHLSAAILEDTGCFSQPPDWPFRTEDCPVCRGGAWPGDMWSITGTTK